MRFQISRTLNPKVAKDQDSSVYQFITLKNLQFEVLHIGVRNGLDVELESELLLLEELVGVVRIDDDLFQWHQNLFGLLFVIVEHQLTGLPNRQHVLRRHSVVQRCGASQEIRQVLSGYELFNRQRFVRILPAFHGRFAVVVVEVGLRKVRRELVQRQLAVRRAGQEFHFSAGVARQGGDDVLHDHIQKPGQSVDEAVLTALRISVTTHADHVVHHVQIEAGPAHAAQIEEDVVAMLSAGQRVDLVDQKQQKLFEQFR